MLAKVYKEAHWSDERDKEIPLDERLGECFEYICPNCKTRSSFDYLGSYELASDELLIQCPKCYKVYRSKYLKYIPKFCPYRIDVNSCQTTHGADPTHPKKTISSKSTTFNTCIGNLCARYQNGKCV